MQGDAGNVPLNRILYVDDEEGLLEIGKYFLEESGPFTVDTFPSAMTALDHLKSVNYDAIISDYKMPDMDGIAFLKALRSDENATPFIIFTGKGREEVVIEALNSGADFYLQKGGDPDAQFMELAHKLLHVISRKKADLALNKSEEDYRHLIEHAGEAIFVTQDEAFKLVNTQLIRLSGYSEQELLGQPFTRFVHPDNTAVLLENYKQRIAGSDTIPSHYVFQIIRKDKTFRWVELNVVAITWDTRPAVLNFMIDITDRKLAEDSLRESEERYRQFFRTSLDGLFITTPDAQWIDFNDAIVGMFGCKNREEIFSNSIAEFYIDPADRAAIVQRVEREGFVREYPLKFKRRGGQVFDALMTVVARKNPDGSTMKFIGTLRDVTGHKRTVDALRESEERYRWIFESFEDLYYQTDTDGIITILSPSLNRLTGWTAEDLIGQPVTKMYVNPGDRQLLLDELRKNGRVQDYEILLKKCDGTHLPVSVSSNIIILPDGTPAGVSGIMRDITERKRAEDAIRDSEVKFQSLVDYALEAIIIIDMKGTVLFANKATSRMIDADKCTDLNGKNVMEVVAPESRAEVSKDFLEVAKGNDAYLARYTLVSLKGREIIVESIGKIISYNGGPAILISLRDVTGKPARNG